MVCLDSGILFSTKKKSHEKTWKKLKYTLISKRRQPEKVTYSMIPTLKFWKRKINGDIFKKVQNQAWWYTLIITAFQEAEAGRLKVLAQPGRFSDLMR